jgi:hypothetical protein
MKLFTTEERKSSMNHVQTIAALIQEPYEDMLGLLGDCS